MSLPPLDVTTGYLPAGVHQAALEEIEDRFGGSYGRKQLLAGLRHVVEQLRALGVVEIWVDGSFVTDKARPKDVEVVYKAPAGADTDSWGLLSFGQRDLLKKYHKVDLWPFPSPQPLPHNPFKTQTIVEFFSTDRSGIEKGVVLLAETDASQEELDHDQK